jgi:multicomponent Na+:H+ antiporter subunit G
LSPIEITSGFLLLVGGFFCVTGGLGLLRMPDFFTRVHGAAVLDSLGAICILLGLMLYAFDDGFSKQAVLLSLKLATILLFLLVTGPAAVHALCKAALGSGISPLLPQEKTAAEETSSND